jgi:protein-tyrosine-phosphatase
MGSARSAIAECSLNRVGQERFKRYSAGSQPSGKIPPMTLALLKKLNL